MIGKSELFAIGYADPPWCFKDKCHAGKRGAGYKYETMTVKEVCDLCIDGVPIRDIFAKDAVLFLWVPPALTVEAVGPVMEAWGFKFNTKAFCWRKTTTHGKDHFGMGSGTRANSEDCWLGIRGNRLKRKDFAVRQMIYDEEIEPDEVIDSMLRQHSRKPDEARDRIVKLYGDLPRIELFARELFPGWSSWGDGVDFARNVVRSAT